MVDAGEMTVEQFKRHLAMRREQLFNLTPEEKGKNNRSYINKSNGSLFVTKGVKLAMQRRRARYKKDTQ